MSVFIFHIFNYTVPFFFIVVAFLELFKFLQLPHSRRLRRWCCPFLPSHTLGTSLREWHGSGLARRKPSEYLPESLRADSPAWLTSPVATPKRTPLNDGCRLWGLGGTNGKAFRHPTFCISRIVHVRRDKYRELPADGQSPQEYVGSARQMTSICPSLPMYTCFLGLPFPLFSVHCQIVPIDTRVHFYTVHILSYHITVTRLSASHQVGEPSSSPIYVVMTANRHFFLSVSGRSVWAAKLWPRISALQVHGAGVSLENLHTLTR